MDSEFEFLSTHACCICTIYLAFLLSICPSEDLAEYHLISGNSRSHTRDALWHALNLNIYTTLDSINGDAYICKSDHTQ